MRRYLRTASGANTTVMPIAHKIECQTEVATGPPSTRLREALASAVTGLIFTHACSQPGSVEVLTKTLLPKVRGNITMNPNPCRLCGDFTNSPSTTQIQPTANPNKNMSKTAASANSGLVPMRKPSREPYPNVIAILA